MARTIHASLILLVLVLLALSLAAPLAPPPISGPGTPSTLARRGSGKTGGLQVCKHVRRMLLLARRGTPGGKPFSFYGHTVDPSTRSFGRIQSYIARKGQEHQINKNKWNTYHSHPHHKRAVGGGEREAGAEEGQKV